MAAIPEFDWSSVRAPSSGSGVGLRVFILRRTSGHHYADRARARLALSVTRPFRKERLFENVTHYGSPNTSDLKHLQRFHDETIAHGKTTMVVLNASLLTRTEIDACGALQTLLKTPGKTTLVVEDATLDKFDPALFDLVLVCCPAKTTKRAVYERLVARAADVDSALKPSFETFDAIIPPNKRGGLFVVDQRAGTDERFSFVNLLTLERRDAEALPDADVPISLSGALEFLQQPPAAAQGYCTIL